MKQILSQYSDYSYALLRIVAGFLFFLHGAQKFGWIGDRVPANIASLIGIAGLIEIVAGAAILIGLFTGIAAFLSSGMMAVAYFMEHFPTGLWPLQRVEGVGSGGELALVYCFLFFFIAMKGSGRWSVDDMVLTED